MYIQKMHLIQSYSLKLYCWSKLNWQQLKSCKMQKCKVNLVSMPSNICRYTKIKDDQKVTSFSGYKIISFTGYKKTS